MPLTLHVGRGLEKIGNVKVFPCSSLMSKFGFSFCSMGV
jgi:hypothetical protein